MRPAWALALLCLWISGAHADELRPETVRAYDRNIRDTETELEKRLQSGHKFLWVDETPQRLSQVRAGEVLIEDRGEGTSQVPGGLIHDWIGAVFVPGATLAKTLAMVEDYNHHRDIYKPDLVASHLVSRNGDDFHIRLRVLKKKIITVVLDTDYDVHYYQLDATRWYSRAYSTRISEIENPGKPDERSLPPGDDHGFLWRLDSYWRFEERDGGVYVECEAVSLTRDIPAGLGWLIGPIIKDLPRAALGNTLRQTRAALAKAAVSEIR
jgi:hypothetical protein